MPLPMVCPKICMAILLGLILSIMGIGCAKKPSPYPAFSEAPYYGEMDQQEDQVMAQGFETRSLSLAKSENPAPAKAKMASSSGSVRGVRASLTDGSQKRPMPEAKPTPVTSAKRMVHYSGRATMKSTEPEKVIDSAIALVKAAGGFLEQRSPSFVALRVPSQNFDTLFYRLLKLATVLDYSQEAEDITEAFNDADLRLKIVVSTLERLEELVKKARTESQKLRLLRELQRYREEKEILEARKRDLVERARFASIHLTVQVYAPWASENNWRQEIRDLLWIHELNPFSDNRFRKRDNLAFSVPDKMVVSQKKNPWRATSSHGSEFWGSEMDVDLLGDSRFWREAIRMRLKEGFKSADTVQAGDFHFAHFKSFGPEPYFYWVGVRSLGDEIELAEFYFPNETEQTQLLPSLLAAVEGKSK